MTDQQQNPAPPKISASAKRFPALALGTSGILLLLISMGAQPGETGTKFPLLALLGLAELGLIVNLVGAYLNFRAAAARTFSVRTLWPIAASLFAAGVFLWLGIWLWPS